MPAVERAAASGDERASIVVIAGPTASGKSALAMSLAAACGGEIVSADSAQVYRGVDVATAKPNEAERALVPHHLLDLRDPWECYSAAEFVADADRAIAEIGARGRLPIVVGGTGLYIRSLLHGLSEAPAAVPELRARLMRELDAHGAASLHARLRDVDPETALRVHPADAVRVIRALEVFEVTGEPISASHRRHGLREWRYRFAGIALARARPDLHARIGERVRRMLAAGLVEECRTLLDSGVPEAAPGLAVIGCREAVAFLRGRLPEEQLAGQIATATRNYARRQLVWLRRQVGFRWFDAEEVLTEQASLVAALASFRDGGGFEVGEKDVAPFGDGSAVSRRPT